MSLFDKANAWVEKVNLGGLYEVSDQFYLFIHTIELVVRTLLNYNLIAKYAGEDLKQTSKLEYVKSYWSTITKHIFHAVLKDTLLLKILQRCINVSANSFIKSWINVMERTSTELYSKSSMAQKSKTALRRTWHQSRKLHLFPVDLVK